MIMKKLKVLLTEGLIERYATGGWESPIIIVPKPYQEHITGVEDLAWRLYASYSGLNRVTNPFEYPIK